MNEEEREFLDAINKIANIESKIDNIPEEIAWHEYFKIFLKENIREGTEDGAYRADMALEEFKTRFRQ